MKRTVAEVLKVYDLVIEIAVLGRLKEVLYFDCTSIGSGRELDFQKITDFYQEEDTPEYKITSAIGGIFRWGQHYKPIGSNIGILTKTTSVQNSIMWFANNNHQWVWHGDSEFKNTHTLDIEITDEEFFQKSLLNEYMFSLCEYKEFLAWVGSNKVPKGYSLTHQNIEQLLYCDDAEYKELYDNLLVLKEEFEKS